MVLTSKWGKIQPQIQIWSVQCVAGSRMGAGRPKTWEKMLMKLRSTMTPSSPTVQWSINYWTTLTLPDSKGSQVSEFTLQPEPAALQWVCCVLHTLYTALCPLSRCSAVTRRSEGWSYNTHGTRPGVKKVDCILQFSISVLHSPGSQLQLQTSEPRSSGPLQWWSWLSVSSPQLQAPELQINDQPTTLQCCSQCCVHSAVQWPYSAVLQSARSGNINQ